MLFSREAHFFSKAMKSQQFRAGENQETIRSLDCTDTSRGGQSLSLCDDEQLWNAFDKMCAEEVASATRLVASYPRSRRLETTTMR